MPRKVIRHPVSIAAAAPAWTPLSLSPYAWWDASDTATITSSGSPARVSQMDDKSGNGLHASNGTGGTQPSTGVLTVNGLNALEMSAVRADVLATAATASLSQPFTILTVWQLTDTPRPARTIDTSAGGRVLTNPSNGTWGIYAGSSVTAGTWDLNAHQMVGVYDGASSEFWIDGSSTGTGNPGSNGFGPSGVILLGSDTVNTMTGAWCESVIVSGAVSSTDRTDWNTYCARWGL